MAGKEEEKKMEEEETDRGGVVTPVSSVQLEAIGVVTVSNEQDEYPAQPTVSCLLSLSFCERVLKGKAW